MNHIWTVMQDGKRLGTVEAISRKGACHEAYSKFSIPHDKQKTVSVHRLTFGIDPGGQDYSGEIVCSFNPNLAEPYRDKTLEDCRQRFENGPFVGFPPRSE